MKNKLFVWVVMILSVATVNAQEDQKKGTKSKTLPENQLDSVPQLQGIQPYVFPENLLLDDQIPTYEQHRFQSQWTVPESSPGKYRQFYRYALPASFITYGVLSRTLQPLKQIDNTIRKEVRQHINGKIHVDDFLQFAPAVSVYAVDLLTPYKAKNSFRDRTFVMATSYLLMGGTVQVMKKNIHAERPDGRGANSFPSGHTATAFVGAHILFKEYRHESIWIGVAGYSAATATGLMRIVNNRHWFSDVVTGAGIGMLSAEVGYLLLPVFHQVFGLKGRQQNFVVAPSIQKNSFSLGMSCVF